MVLVFRNSKGYNPYRDAKGRFTTGPIKQASKSFSKILKLQEDQAWIVYDSDKYQAINREIEIEKKKISRVFRETFQGNNMSAEYSKQKKRLREWSEGNGYRDDKTGKYVISPKLEKYKNSSAQKLHTEITQAILKEAGVNQITVYRGQKTETRPLGLTSFTENMFKASNFGSRKMKKTISVDRVISHHLLDTDFKYRNEDEVIIDMF